MNTIHYQNGRSRAEYEIKSREFTKPRKISKHVSKWWRRGYRDRWRQAQAAAPLQNAEMPYRPGFGVPIMVDAHLEEPFVIFTEDITGLLTAISKFVQKLNEAKRRELQLRVGKHRFSAN